MALKRKIVVTGLGWVTPFGCSLDIWKMIFSGKSAVKSSEGFDLDGIYCKISAQIPKSEEYFPWEKWQKAMPGKRAGKFIIYGMEAAEAALLDSGLLNQDLTAKSFRIGIIAGSGIGGLEEVYETSKVILERGADRVSPMFVPSALINLLGGNIAIRHKIYGPNQSQVTACATGAHAIADGARMIFEDRADIMVVGAAEASICRIGIAGFCAMRALASGFNETPEKASRPFDTARSGFVMGEGAGFLVLEEEQHALARGAKIYCEYLDAGLSADAYQMTAPPEDGAGAARAMSECLERSGVKSDEVQYLNAHATSTGVGDRAELRAIKSVFKDSLDSLSISSIKGSIGHLLGASGSVESIATVLSIFHQQVPPTLNLESPDEEAYENGVLLDLVPGIGKNKPITHALSNAFGFGGVNIALLFKKYL